ncbi:MULTISPECIES: DSD1 family PLP-dependent enzyme [Ramlibacter]|uniref:DSD1 family PLP-dependent enzyme n=1 Tax=Ramlibacter aquaticus TaxID=2780094 RepID=A0ABR9S9V8_9BURK|nr:MULTISPECIES: DSD1 family PLP-dependent enzyme [Ramlibacter]MBE7939126.1 DSD1 family PLP-dependent enzyme [Ramlibacter aquaticus]
MTAAPEARLPRPGQPVDAIDTPALVVDLDAMERNIARMATFARDQGMKWRPHAKMHKCAELAVQMVAAGAVGACVQKTAEAEAMAAGGVLDLYISNEVVAPAKLARVAALALDLAGRGGRLSIAVDSEAGIQGLAHALAARGAGPAAMDVFVEIDVGQGRCGVPPGEAAVALARAIAQHAELHFAGLQAYQGRAQHLRGVAERHEAIAAAVRDARHTRECIEAAGLPVGLVTGAGTGTFACEAASGLYGELQTGSFLFMDADYGRNAPDPAQPRFEHALFVKAQVISRSRDHAVCDAGHKSHAIDSGLPAVWPHPALGTLEFANGGDEHGILRPDPARGLLPAIGDSVWLVPGHCDPTVNLHAHMVGVRGGLQAGVVERLLRVDARGALT